VGDTNSVETDKDMVTRPVGRPRRYDDEKERELIFSAAYRALRDHRGDVTIARILKEAGVSTRSFYRHFESKEALLSAMFRRDAAWAATKMNQRLARASSPEQAVKMWIDEIFKIMGDSKRAERVAVLGSITADLGGDRIRSSDARGLLLAPLTEAIVAGVNAGSFSVSDPVAAADLVASTAMQAARLNQVPSEIEHDVSEVARFCLGGLKS
jgi:AcrR family transcriptional regulator